jgi:hypothetical protein
MALLAAVLNKKAECFMANKSAEGEHSKAFTDVIRNNEKEIRKGQISD